MHYGELLASRVTKSGLSITWVAEQAGYKRGTYYTHIAKPDLSMTVLDRYGKVLGYDFSKHFSRKYRSEEDESFPSYQELKKECDYWRNKYTDIVKEYDDLKEAYEALKKSRDQPSS